MKNLDDEMKTRERCLLDIAISAMRLSGAYQIAQRTGSFSPDRPLGTFELESIKKILRTELELHEKFRNLESADLDERSWSRMVIAAFGEDVFHEVQKISEVDPAIARSRLLEHLELSRDAKGDQSPDEK